MSAILKIAWRNLWRNKRRTIITAASIFFAVFFAIGMRSFQLGTYDHMIKQVIESYSGYIQVQHPDYSDDPGIDNAFSWDDKIMTLLSENKNVKTVVPRIESFALISAGNLSKGVMISGIKPEKEIEMSDPVDKLVRYRLSKQIVIEFISQNKVSQECADLLKTVENQSYTNKISLAADIKLDISKDATLLNKLCELSKYNSYYLNNIDDGVLISDRLSRYLKVNTGDTIVLMGQGYQGVSAANVFPVRGVVKMPSPELDNKLVYMTLEKASEFFSLYGNITSIAINLYDTDKMKSSQKELKKMLEKNNLIVKNWQELNPALVQQIEGDNKSGLIFLAVLYVIIFFGIFGTVQMMISERTREFGVMVAIGMKRTFLAYIVTTEMFLLGFIGTAAGMVVSIPLLLWGHYYPFRLNGEMARMYTDIGFDPVMPMALFDAYFFQQAIVILVMVFAACYLPVRNILKLNIIKAIHG